MANRVLRVSVDRVPPEAVPPLRTEAARSPELADLSRLDAMRRHLVASRPTSGNEALRLLRAAFPHAPLAERVKAADEARGGY